MSAAAAEPQTRASASTRPSHTRSAGRAGCATRRRGKRTGAKRVRCAGSGTASSESCAAAAAATEGEANPARAGVAGGLPPLGDVDRPLPPPCGAASLRRSDATSASMSEAGSVASGDARGAPVLKRPGDVRDANATLRGDEGAVKARGEDEALPVVAPPPRATTRIVR